MTAIPDYFCGHLKAENDVFVFSVQDHVVKLLSTKTNENENIASLIKLADFEVKKPQYLRGIDEANHEIAFLFQTGSKIVFDQFRSLTFGTPIIIKSCGNAQGFYQLLTSEWDKFDAISFSGGIINAVYNPKIAALERSTPSEMAEIYRDFDGARTIEIKPSPDYTRSVSVALDNQNAEMTVSVSHSGGYGGVNNVSLGSLGSFIRLEFEHSQTFDKIACYYTVLRKLLALLVGQNNVSFDVALHQRTKDNKFIKTANCKINDGYDDYCEKGFHSVISLDKVFPYIPKLFEIIKSSKNNANHILALLPESNKRLGRITFTKVQALCTALEVEYRANGYERPRDARIEELKRDIGLCVKAFLEKNPDLDVYKKTTISTVYKNLDYSLSDKIFFLYGEHKDVVDELASDLFVPEITQESIRSFVRLRNTGTHTGIADWGDNGKMYAPLLGLAYLCLLNRTGMPREEGAKVLRQLFY